MNHPKSMFQLSGVHCNSTHTHDHLAADVVHLLPSARRLLSLRVKRTEYYRGIDNYLNFFGGLIILIV